jgi:hypothetical protein
MNYYCIDIEMKKSTWQVSNSKAGGGIRLHRPTATGSSSPPAGIAQSQQIEQVVSRGQLRYKNDRLLGEHNALKSVANHD